MEAASTLAPAAMPQHMQALAHANRVRLARASLKRAIATGAVDAAEIVRECPWEAESMSIGELLRSQRRWGRTRARKFLFSIAVNENRELNRLTSRQRELLAAELEAKRPLYAELAATGGFDRSSKGRALSARPAAIAARSLEADVERHRAGAGEAEEPDPEADDCQAGRGDQDHLERR